MMGICIWQTTKLILFRNLSMNKNGRLTHKMADDVHEEIENALNTIATTTERSGNMKKELKHTIYETVSTLWKLFVKLKDM